MSFLPPIAIIIPAHNPGPFLREALRSIHQQTFRNFELIVVDDNSSEDLSWVHAEFPRARCLRQPHGGVSIARNNGILNTTAPLIAFMDQDDLWLPQKLERQFAAMAAAPAAGVCYCDLDVFHADSPPTIALPGPASPASDPIHAITELDPAHPLHASDLRSPLYRSLQHFSSRFIVPSTVMIRRSALATSGLLDPFIPFSGDYDLLIKLGSRHKVLRVPAADVLYRKHDNNFSDQYQVGRGEVDALVSRYQNYAKATNDRLLFEGAARMFRRPKKIYSAQAFDCARRSLRQRNYAATFGHLARALYFSPTFVLRSLSQWIRARFNKPHTA